MGAGNGQQARRATIAGLMIAPVIAAVATVIFVEPHTKEVCCQLYNYLSPSICSVSTCPQMTRCQLEANEQRIG